MTELDTVRLVLDGQNMCYIFQRKLRGVIISSCGSEMDDHIPHVGGLPRPVFFIPLVPLQVSMIKAL